MLGRLSLVIAGLLLASTPALGVEVVTSAFQVSYSQHGKEYRADDLVVPLLPDNACYNWFVQLAEANLPVKATERFTLPEALPSWETTASAPGDATQIEENGKVAVTTVEQTTDTEGWFSHGWCVAEGDPLGLHVVEVSVDGASIAKFEFTVVPPEAYRFPVPPPPDPSGRSTGNSW
jgi:hypothetical protein